MCAQDPCTGEWVPPSPEFSIMRCAFTGCVLPFVPGLPIGGRQLPKLPSATTMRGTDAEMPAFTQNPRTKGGAHNQRHLACGGLRRVMGAHAVEAVRLAWDVSRSQIS